jgi:hypothetical protein
MVNGSISSYGYDDNFVLNDYSGKLARRITAIDPGSGRGWRFQQQSREFSFTPPTGLTAPWLGKAANLISNTRLLPWRPNTSPIQ